MISASSLRVSSIVTFIRVHVISQKLYIGTRSAFNTVIPCYCCESPPSWFTLMRNKCLVYLLVGLCIPTSRFIQLQSRTADFIHQIRSDQISHSVMSNSLRPHESQHARLLCPSPTPRVHSDSCPSSQWCHPAISSSVVPFSSCPQSLPASESFPMS